MKLRREHTCQVRTTSSLLSKRCGKPATDVRREWSGVLWVCPEHQIFSPPRT